MLYQLNSLESSCSHTDAGFWSPARKPESIGIAVPLMFRAILEARKSASHATSIAFHKLALLLNASVGYTRPVVDMGYIDHEESMIGTSGKVLDDLLAAFGE